MIRFLTSFESEIILFKRFSSRVKKPANAENGKRRGDKPRLLFQKNPEFDL